MARTSLEYRATVLTFGLKLNVEADVLYERYVSRSPIQGGSGTTKKVWTPASDNVFVDDPFINRYG